MNNMQSPNFSRKFTNQYEAMMGIGLKLNQFIER